MEDIINTILWEAEYNGPLHMTDIEKILIENDTCPWCFSPLRQLTADEYRETLDPGHNVYETVVIGLECDICDWKEDF